MFCYCSKLRAPPKKTNYQRWSEWRTSDHREEEERPKTICPSKSAIWKLHEKNLKLIFFFLVIYFSLISSFNLPAHSLFLPSHKTSCVCLQVSIPQPSSTFPGGPTVNNWQKTKSTCVCYKSDIYAKRMLERKRRQLMQHRAVVCGFLRVTWEALNVAQGQTAGRQVEDNNGNNDHSSGSQRRHRDHSVFRRSISCPLKRNRDTGSWWGQGVEEAGEVKWRLCLMFRSTWGGMWTAAVGIWSALCPADHKCGSAFLCDSSVTQV